MPRPPAQELMNVSETSANRAPKDNDWGLFARDDWNFGVGLFPWFETKSEMLGYVRKYLPYLEDGDDEENDLMASEVDAILSTLPGEPTEGVRAAINDALSGGQDLEWWGTFADLCTGSTEFAARVRGRFRESVNEGTDKVEDLSRPIADAEHVDFGHSLQAYGH